MGPKARRGLAATAVALFASFLAGGAVLLLTEGMGQTNTVFRGNGALALMFSAAPACVTGVSIALAVWWTVGARWGRAGLVSGGLCFVAAMLANFSPMVLNLFAGMDLAVASRASSAVAVPLMAMTVGLGMAAWLSGLTRWSVILGVGTGLLVSATLSLGLWFALPVVLWPAFVGPTITGLSSRSGRPDVPRGGWLWLVLLLLPAAFFSGTLLGSRAWALLNNS